MNIELLQKKIDETEYWDMLILAIQTKFFGDEIYIYIENDRKTCWKIDFKTCFKVNYETDATWRSIESVSKMRGGQLGYYGQDIAIKKYEGNEEFIECSLDFSIMTMNIVCKEISVQKIKMDDSTLKL